MAPWTKSEMNEDKLELHVTIHVEVLCEKQKCVEALMMTITQLSFFLLPNLASSSSSNNNDSKKKNLLRRAGDDLLYEASAQGID